MHLVFQNINDAFRGICQGFHSGQFSQPESLNIICSPNMSRTASRYGKVIVIEEPVTITYEKPLQRVLFNPYRDCNPFFHLIEALWTLAGRNDIEPLCHFVKRAAEFSDDGKTWRGAYGARWYDGCVPRKIGETFDEELNMKLYERDPNDTQVHQAIDILKNDRTCRRVVLTQYESYDLLEVLENPTVKDIPCNTEVMFLPRRQMFVIRGGKRVPVDIPEVRFPEDPDNVVKADIEEYLDMTVINRSNDMLWGALGSNYVTFSFLLEYVALAAGYIPGRYHQVSNNLHVYTHDQQAGPNLEEMKPTGKVYWSGKWEPEKLIENTPLTHTYPDNGWDGILFGPSTRGAFDEDCCQLFERKLWCIQNTCGLFKSSFFINVVSPMIDIWNVRKLDIELSILGTRNILAEDWAIACRQWLERRKK